MDADKSDDLFPNLRNPEGTQFINDRCLVKTQDGQCLVIVSGIVLAQFAAADRMAGAYAMVHLVEQGWARQQEVARVFGCSTRKVRRDQQRFEDGGLAALGCGSGYAFEGSGLHQAYFQGNAPLVDGVAGSADSTVFQGESGTVYYYAGTTGWGSTHGGWPTVELFAPPQIGGSRSIGIQSGNFGFTITAASNQTVVVEASTNLVSWQPVWTNNLSGTSVNFSDSQWKNFPNRFYRAR
jgi:hypothetical protein